MKECLIRGNNKEIKQKKKRPKLESANTVKRDGHIQLTCVSARARIDDSGDKDRNREKGCDITVTVRLEWLDTTINFT